MEGEGVDDYGGPYREVFSHIAAELQQLQQQQPGGGAAAAACALPLLLPSPNAAGAGGEEQGMRVLHPAPLGTTWRALWGAAELRAAAAGAPAALLPPVGAPAAEAVLHPTIETHLVFVGQLIGIAVRSHVHIGLALPPSVWRGLAGEPLLQGGLADLEAQVSGAAQGRGCLQGTPHFSLLLSQLRLIDSAAVAALACGLSAAVAWALDALGGSACSCGACAPALEEAAAAATALEVSGAPPSAVSPAARAAATALLRLLDRAHPPCACPGVAAAAAAASSAPAPGLEDSLWAVTLSSGDAVALFPGPRTGLGAGAAPAAAGVPVTVRDWLDGAYARAVLSARVAEAAPPLAALRRGLLSVLPAAALPLIGAAGLRAAVCGADDVDVDLLAANTELEEGLPPDAPHVLALWRVLRGFDAPQRRAFLRFVWARSALPAAAADFTQKFKLQTMTLGGAGGGGGGGVLEAEAAAAAAGSAAPPPSAAAPEQGPAASSVSLPGGPAPPHSHAPAAGAASAAALLPAPLTARGPATLPSEDLMLLSAAGRRAAQLAAAAAGAAPGGAGGGVGGAGTRPGSGAPRQASDRPLSRVSSAGAGGLTPRLFAPPAAAMSGAPAAPAPAAAERPASALRSARAASAASLRPPLHAPQQLSHPSAAAAAAGGASAASVDAWLPTAHTCFFSLHLPRYSSDAVLRRQLLYAITHCLALDADFRLTEAEAGATWGL